MLMTIKMTRIMQVDQDDDDNYSDDADGDDDYCDDDDAADADADDDKI